MCTGAAAMTFAFSECLDFPSLSDRSYMKPPPLAFINSQLYYVYFCGYRDIRVKLESDGKVVDVKRLDAVLVTDEAAAAPEESKNDRYSGERAR